MNEPNISVGITDPPTRLRKFPVTPTGYAQAVAFIDTLEGKLDGRYYLDAPEGFDPTPTNEPVPLDRRVITTDYGEGDGPHGATDEYQVLVFMPDGSLCTPMGGCDSLTLEQAEMVYRHGDIWYEGDSATLRSWPGEPLATPDTSSEFTLVLVVLDTGTEFIVEVEEDTHEAMKSVQSRIDEGVEIACQPSYTRETLLVQFPPHRIAYIASRP